METRGSSLQKAPPKDDKVVSTAVAKRDWFVKSADLATLPRSGGGAAWGFGRFPTYYSVKDLDWLALCVHGGAAGFARKKDAQKRRLENKEQKLKAKHVAKKQRARKFVKKEAEEDAEEVEDVQFSGKRRAKSASGSKWWTLNDVFDEVQDSDDDFEPGK
jgi:hypothetical protein